MKKLFSLLFLLTSLFFVQPVFAGNDITITCNIGDSECTVSPNLPIFSETNIYPGFSTSQSFYVNNNRQGVCNLTLKAISNSVSDPLSSKIFISIVGTNNGNNLNISNYLLSDLLDPAKSKLSLGHVNKNKKNSYLWTVTLDQSADNNYQNLTSNFNINFNFECDDEATDPTPTATPTLSQSSSDNSDSSSGQVLGTECTNSVPDAPTGLYGVRNASGSVTLHWDNTTSTYTGYLLAFGTSPGTYQYGLPDIGTGNSYTVNGLTYGAQYCFYIRSLNGCMPGDRTPEYCVNPGSTVAATVPDQYQNQVLGVNTEDETPDNTDKLDNQENGQVLGSAVCTGHWLPILFVLAFILNLVYIRHFTKLTNLIPFLISTLAFIIDYSLLKKYCCPFDWFCQYFWIGNILSFIFPSLLFRKNLDK